MRNLLTKWFGAAKGNVNALPAPEQDDKPEQDESRSLRDEFKSAVYGNRFRTLAYINSLDDPETADQEWLEAYCLSGRDDWRIKKITFHKGDITGRPAEYDVPLDGRYSFIEAAEKLALYEATQKDLNKLPCSRPSLEELGYSHVRAFAERELLVFDLDGNIHPTKDGMVVTKGWFEPETKEKLAGYYTQRQDMKIHAVPVEKIIDTFLPQDSRGTLAEFRRDDKMVSLLDEACSAAKAIMKDIRNFEEYDIKFYRDAMNGKKAAFELNRSFHLLYSRAVDILHRPEKFSESAEPEAVSVLTPALQLFGFFALISLASCTQVFIEQADKDKPYMDGAVDAFLWHATRKMGKLGVPPEESEMIVKRTFRTYMNYHNGNADFRVSRHKGMKKVLGHLDNIRDFYQARMEVGGVDEVAELPSMTALFDKITQDFGGENRKNEDFELAAKEALQESFRKNDALNKQFRR